MIKTYLFLTLIFVASFGAMATNLKADDSIDDREAIILPAPERNLVLAEMRGFLEAVQAITAGLVENDLKAISGNAHKVGMANARAVPAALMKKLPQQFRELGAATHKQFDEISSEAREIGDRDVILKKLGNLMLNCTTCHSIYKLVPLKEGSK